MDMTQPINATCPKKARQHAPQLLEALEICLGHLTGGLDGNYADCDPIDVARKALQAVKSPSSSLSSFENEERELTKHPIAFHNEKTKDWLMRYLINNPRTSVNDEILLRGFSRAFPEHGGEYLAETVEDELQALYRQGVADKYALQYFYICEDVQQVIRSCSTHGRTPEWP